MKSVKFTIPFLAALMLVGTSTTLSAAEETTNWRDALQRNHPDSLNNHAHPRAA